MKASDVVNAAFELGGGIGLTLDCRRILRDKVVMGIDWRVRAFFGAWGYWNLFYYANLAQPVSFATGVLPCVANTLWVVLYLRYRGRK